MMASRALRQITAEPWAIEPSWLPILAAIAQRNTSADEIEAAKEWTRRDFVAAAGPGAQRLAGGHKALVVNGIAMLPLIGPIFPRANVFTEMSGATSLSILAHDYRTALANKDVRGIMLVIDSPGGQVSGTANFASMIAAGNRQKPTVAHVEGSAASGAYWIASAAGRISIDRTAMLGSIGVAVAIPKQVEPGQDGFITVEVVSSNAPNKRPDAATEEGIAEVRGMLDAVERIFIGDVARGRGVTTAKVVADFGRGGVLIGTAAVGAAMADKVESHQSAMNALQLLIRSPASMQQFGAASQAASNRARLAAFAPSETDRISRNKARLAALRPR
jgi:ClpP class serine protease